MRCKNKMQRRVADKVACVILAGGKGTRLFPLTQSRCKPAVAFGGHYRLIDIPISNALNAEMRNIFVISQYFSSGLNNHIKETYRLDAFHGGNINLLSPEETPDDKVWFEGTADAVRKNLDYFLKFPIDYFLILSGDQLYNMDLQAMLEFAQQKDADLTVATLPIGEKDASRMGIMKIDPAYNIVDFLEKPADPSPMRLTEQMMESHDIKEPYLASMGIYIFKKEVLIKLLEEIPQEDFGKHMIPAQMKKGNTAAFLYQGYWEDIGTVKSYYEANLALTTNSLGLNLYDESNPIYSHAPSLPCPRVIGSKIEQSVVCHGAIIHAKEISHSVIGVRTRVGEGTTIKDSIVIGNECFSKSWGIGKNCHIEKAIIDENVSIGNNVTLVNKDNIETQDGNEVMIRDGIIIVTAGTTLPDGYTL